MTEQQPPYEPVQGPPPPGQPGPSVQPGEPVQPYPAYAPYPGGPPGVPPGGYSPHPAGPASKGLAIAALVLAIFGFFVITAVIAIVLAIVVLSKSKDGRDHGKGLAIAAIIIAPLWLLLIAGLAAIGIVSDADRDSSGAIKDEGNVRVTSVKVGDCIKDGIAGQNYYSLKAAPCAQPHQLEAYAAFDLPGGAYPGDTKVLELAEKGCADRYKAFVGRSFDESSLEVQYLYPLKSSWNDDQGVTCFVGEGRATTGTLKGVDK